MANMFPPMTLSPGEVHVWFAWTDLCGDGVLDSYLALLSDAERARMECFAFDHLKKEYLLTRALCRVALSQYVALHPASWRFQTNAYGRPEIANSGLPMSLRFNISNTSELIACAITLDSAVGIDVESVRHGDQGTKIAERFFSPLEVSSLKAMPASEREDFFLELWTLKEAYIKARGLGMTIPLERFAFQCDRGAVNVTFDPDFGDESAHWQFESRAIGGRHRMAIAVNRMDRPDFSISFYEGVPTWCDSRY